MRGHLQDYGTLLASSLFQAFQVFFNMNSRTFVSSGFLIVCHEATPMVHPLDIVYTTEIFNCTISHWSEQLYLPFTVT